MPALAGQPGSKQDIHAGDNRFSSGVVSQGGLLWAVQTVEQDGHTALRWVKIDATTNTLKQEGFIADSNLDFYYGSIAVNNAGKVVVGFNGSGGDQFISAYAVLGETDAAGLTVFGTPLLLKGGVADYQGLDGAGRNRWGDYSATMIDPDSPNSFWTFQEWVAAPDLWAIQITELRVVPLPSTLLLMASGLMGLWAAARRNRRK